MDLREPRRASVRRARRGGARPRVAPRRSGSRVERDRGRQGVRPGDGRKRPDDAASAGRRHGRDPSAESHSGRRRSRSLRARRAHVQRRHWHRANGARAEHFEASASRDLEASYLGRRRLERREARRRSSPHGKPISAKAAGVRARRAAGSEAAFRPTAAFSGTGLEEIRKGELGSRHLERRSKARRLLPSRERPQSRRRSRIASRRNRVPAKDALYIGVEACANCHDEEYKFWQHTPHGGAYATLSKEHKEFNLDCVSCHVTGYEKPGGSTVTHVAGLENVQCEVCHGPGSRHEDQPVGPSDAPASKAHPKSLCAPAVCHHPPRKSEGWSVDRHVENHHRQRPPEKAVLSAIGYWGAYPSVPAPRSFAFANCAPRYSLRSAP